MTGRVLILANPASGRDVRRISTRASSVTTETKRDLVARIALGLDAAGIDEIMVLREPFRIATGALETLDLRAFVTELDVGVTNTSLDSERAVDAARRRGCDVVVALGGDGTSRIVAKTWPDAVLMPLSTGTNNVFPVHVEATAAGLAAGLVAARRCPRDVAACRCKMIQVVGDGWRDVALVDAVLLHDDHIGNLGPLDPGQISRIVLARAEPAAVGISPIGGLLQPVGAEADHGLALRLGPGTRLHVPTAPGLFRTVDVAESQRLAFRSTIGFDGPAVVALDGDRLHTLDLDERAVISVDRSGPWVIDVSQTLEFAAHRGLLGRPSN